VRPRGCRPRPSSPSGSPGPSRSHAPPRLPRGLRQGLLGPRTESARGPGERGGALRVAPLRFARPRRAGPRSARSTRCVNTERSRAARPPSASLPRRPLPEALRGRPARHAQARQLLAEVDLLREELARARKDDRPVPEFRHFARKAAGALGNRLQNVAAFNPGGCRTSQEAEARAFLVKLQRIAGVSLRAPPADPLAVPPRFWGRVYEPMVRARRRGQRRAGLPTSPSRAGRTTHGEVGASGQSFSRRHGT
jgi:hypothetical protein